MHATGDWQCPICGFVLHKLLLRASDGAVGINPDNHRPSDPGEPCPNDGATLVPLEE